MKNILDQLNKEQRAAVECIKGPVMIIAGAGSGKTRALTYRIAHLLDSGVDPFNILALTFTNKAAREMKERIISLVGDGDAKNVWMGTFHSVFARILRFEAERLGYPKSFAIYDTDDSKSLIKSIVKDMNLDPKTYAPGMILGRISSAKSSLISHIDYNDNSEFRQQDKQSGKSQIGEIFTQYNLRLKRSGAMDFDDLLFNTNILLRDFPEVLYKYQSKFKYILVDEYQDTNFAQYLIIKQLAARLENICVVGDDAQSIYGFRGANIQNILNFKRDYPEAKIFKLEQNYRSTQNIVNAANSLIDKNRDQIKKTIFTENEPGDKIKLFKSPSDGEEAMQIANSIFELKMNHQLKNDAFAILYRTNAQSRTFEEALRKLNLPYRIYGGLSFYKRKEIKDVLCYFRLVVNHEDEEAMIRIINYPARGIGNTTIDRLRIAADQTGVSLWSVVNNIYAFNTGINTGIASKIKAFADMIESLAIQSQKKNAFESAHQIVLASGILRELKENDTDEDENRADNIEELLNAIQDFSVRPRENAEDTDIPLSNNELRTLDEFLQEVSLLTDADEKDEDQNIEKITLMTIHASKGLEFPVVYIVGLEENLFPNFQAISSRADLEEERRLFYVAITRAEQRLFLSYAETRFRWGQPTFCEPSRFIDDIDQQFIDLPKKKKVINSLLGGGMKNDFNNIFSKPSKPVDPSKSTEPFKLNVKTTFQPISKPDNLSEEINDFNQIQPGMNVFHEKFGQGKVLEIEGSDANKKATVFFNAVGQKQLLLKFAKLRIIG